MGGGAGLVTVATPEGVHPVVAADLPSALTLPLADEDGVLSERGAAAAREAAESMDAVAVGPGLTVEAAPFLRAFLPSLSKPLVVDADALNVLAAEPGLLAGAAGPPILTPHPGEAARLLGRAVPGDPESREQACRDLAGRFGAVAVLKGAGTVVCDADRVYTNETGNPGMATGGTGDVLTGLLAALLAGGADPWTAAVQGVHLHGRAGDLAALAVGERGMVATDLAANLSRALSELVERRPRTRTGGGRGAASRRRRGSSG
ncbi:MAG: NAD(P)H-hydrate dehydratase [Planctomycetota bacterium]